MLENNLKYIEKYNPSLAQLIRNHKIVGNCSYDLAASGDVILYYENVPFHSEQDPQQEALDIFNSLSNTSKSAVNFTFGLGLGYLFKRLFISSKGRIVIYETNTDILRATFENVDFSQELSDPRVILVNKLEDLDMVFNKFYKYEDPINVCFLPIYKAAFGDRIKELSEKLGFLKGYYNNNFYTLFELSQKWLEMGFNNVDKVFNCQYIDCLKDKFKGKPAIIASAGPSLLKNANLLKDYQDKCVVFSVGGALRPVINKFGITPDFCSFIDVSEKILPQLDHIKDISEINFIVQPPTYKEFYNLKPRRHFVYLPANDEFSNWLANTMSIDNKGCYNRGTVAMSAVTSAIHFGCDPIILIGQDLAYQEDGRVYADDKTENLYEAKDNFAVKGWYGDQVTSNSSFAIFIKYFETFASQYKGKVKLINATEGGAYLEGFEHITFDEALKLVPDDVFDVEKIINDAENDYINPLKARKKVVYDSLKENKNSLIQLQKIIISSFDLLKGIFNEINNVSFNKSYLLNKFQQLYENNGKIDKIIKEKAPLIRPFIQKEAHAFNQGFGRFKSVSTIEEVEEYLQLSADYYKVLLDKIPILEKYLAKIVG